MLSYSSQSRCYYRWVRHSKLYLCICVFVFVYLYLYLYLYQCHHDAYNEGGREAEMNKQGRTLADVPRNATACLCDCEATAAPCDL